MEMVKDNTIKQNRLFGIFIFYFMFLTFKLTEQDIKELESYIRKHIGLYC